MIIQRQSRNKKGMLKSGTRFIKRVGVLPKFIKDQNISIWKKIMVFIGLAYVINPFDLLPVPVFLAFGLIDDAVIIGYILSKISDELDYYIENPYSKEFSKDKIIDDIEYRIDDEE
ncbi:Uncharacterized membrane protein YkvA, DUF1232 family [Geosporobacter subterraneus DSM 17957]|uniref:Uncharacterized membrane protein YkvA, DUF1232 family n=1 Tax=Geosporobacter subterraneus DSM 17957 TaxID=1121919 RepID=A0A1M6GYD8_9FIRM|nr:DUF1232 domain-containing protein [Geosporobacter subterraneus]SHJ14969.1 Uncharacterized membrane protein YkvA, DUF1232 family [Geosporobacter subterraneus DSM 17957]